MHAQHFFHPDHVIPAVEFIAAFVKSIERFSLTMTNGKKIPVPEKKYTAVKAMLLKNGF